ncbi:efflux RND transporter permease subunit [Siphonobacter aquaeclarae]|jgi:multidrug efflux pump|uniref:Multidrug efflux pump n=1 Tax=Siphonobacter aquaeclarae TaxID=563176 RepID=A0A1G9IWD6_9BACT|nr:efflux RND transporter permease subunit [Siphonobacter aquaeclarae]SDL29365.1 multidrug efflux pump [Siphonobacter aquaeclarae]
MSLSGLSIQRPVLAGVLSVLIVLFGMVGLTYLGIREYPVTDSPIVTVTTSYPGASPDVIAYQITKPLEEAIGEANGIRTISSVSREAASVITVEFNLDADLEAAANDVRDKVTKARRLLPADVDPPIVEKANSGDIVIFMAVESKTRSILEVSNLASTVIKERMQTIPGVKRVGIAGEKKYAMRLRIDPAKLAAYQLTPADIEQALRRENVDLPSGRVEGDRNELTVRTLGRLTKEDDFNNMIIKQEGESIIRFRDLGYAELGAENERTAILNSLKGNSATIGVFVEPQRGANAVAIADEFYKRLQELRKEIPKEYELTIGKDFTEPIRASISEVEETLFIAFGLVILILFIFLRDWRSTIIPVVAIPVSIISAFFIMYFAGYSINILTLLALVLAIGLVVDDAIVVLENIYAKVEEGMSPLEAAFKGSSEIYFAVISTTITLAAVFLPILFLPGITGKLFQEFAVVVAGSVLVSAFVALTLSPMMSAYLLKHQDQPNWLYRKTEPFFVRLNKGYERSLAWFLRYRWLAFPALAVNIGLIYVIGKQLPSELAPLEDRSQISLAVLAPEGSSYEYTEKYMNEIAKFTVDSTPGLFQSYSILALTFGPPAPVNLAIQNVFLTKPGERKTTQADVFNIYSRNTQQFRGVLAFPVQPPTIGSRFGQAQPVQFVLQATQLAELTKVLPKFIEEARKSEVLRFVDSDLKVNKPELVLQINRDKAAELGISTAEIARSLQLALSGQRYGYFIYNDRQYEVIGQLQRDDRSTPYDLKSMFVRTRTGEMVSIDNLVSFRESISPAAIYRYDQAISATVSGGLAPGKTIGDGIAEMQRIAAKVLPPAIKTSLAGESRDFAESSSSLLFAFVFALVLIYLVLAAQFESLIDPLIILLTVPMAMTGALLSLWLFGQTLNIFSQIGIITLIGLITKNGILIVEFANQSKEEGLKPLEAARVAAASRFRPILMTSLAMIFGAIPIALTVNSRSSLGTVIVGGLTFAGLLTLYVIPAIYSYFSRTSSHKKKPEPELATV